MRRVAAVFLRRIEASVSGLAAGRSVSVGLCALCDNPPSTPLFPLYPALFLCSLVPPTPLSSALSPRDTPRAMDTFNFSSSFKVSYSEIESKEKCTYQLPTE